jgi:hypothetical protein
MAFVVDEHPSAKDQLAALWLAADSSVGKLLPQRHIASPSH